DGKFEMKNKQQSAEYGITAQDNCMECHGDNVPEPKRT
ncbi:MAG: chain A iron centre cytochrome C protein, partial [Anaerolineaceae bacterium]